MASPLSFTIGIPVRNGEEFLAAAIESAVSQTRPADEILVMDDASTDQTRAIATSERWNGRVRYEFNPAPSGFADAFNRVAAAAKSRFFVLLSADDLLDPNLLEEIEKALQRFPEARFCYVGNRYIDKNGNPLSKPSEQAGEPLRFLDGEAYVRDYLFGVALLGRELHRCLGFAVERKLIVEECPFRKEAGFLADNDFFFRVASKTKVVGINRPLATVRMHSGSGSWRGDSLHLRLAEDYLFQIRSLRDTSTIRGENLALVCHLACRIFNSLLKEAVSRGRMDLGDAALRLIQATADEIGEQPFREGMKQDWMLRWIYGKPGRVRLYRRMLGLASWARNVSWLKNGKDCVLQVLRRFRAKSWS